MIEEEIKQLYQAVLDGWNQRSAAGMAAPFAENGSIVGFDGSQMNSRAEIEAELLPIFANHPTARFVSIVEEVRPLASDVALLRAIVGMVPPGSKGINPAVNAIQSMVAVKEGNMWRVALFQNTPAQLHGRPLLVEQMTSKLQAVAT